MPNWCEGNIRLRGTGAAIREFLKNEIVAIGYAGGGVLGGMSKCPIEVADFDGDLFVKIPENALSWRFRKMFIKDTARNFIDTQDSFYVYTEGEEEVSTVCIDGFQAAWGVISAPYVEKAKKYGIDIKIVGFERGMQFAQIIEIVNGELLKDQEIKFDDWHWECIMPNMGG